MARRTCWHCGREFEGRGWFCSTPHRKRAQRRRKAGLPENAFNGPQGGRRGRVPLGRITKTEGAREARERTQATITWFLEPPRW